MSVTVVTVFLPLAGRRLAAATAATIKRKCISKNQWLNERSNTFLCTRGFEMIVNAMTESVDLVKIIRESESRILVVEVGNDLVNGRGNFEKERMINELGKTVKRKLENV